MKPSTENSGIKTEIFNSPRKFIISILISVLLIEALLLLLYHFVFHSYGFIFAVSVSILLVAILSPVIYFKVFRPLVKHIAEHKLAEESLFKANDFTESLVQTANVIVVGLNKDGDINLMNQTAEKITGYTAEELTGKNWFEILVPKDKFPKAWDEFVAFIQTGNKSATSENPILTKSGEERYISWQNGILHEGDKIAGIISFGIDITERRQAEEELHKFKLGIENSKDAVFITNTEGVITYSNQSFEGIYGFSNTETIGQTPRILKSGLLPAEVYEAFWRKLLSKQIVAGEIINKTKDGKIITIDGSNNPILDASGNIIGFLSIHRDITKRKQLELEKQIQSEIVHSVTITADLTELLMLIHQSIKKVIYAENCFFALHDEETGLFSFPYSIDKFDEAPMSAALHKSCTAYVFRAGKPMLMNSDLFADLTTQNEVELIGSFSPSWIGIPLQTSSRIIGVMVMQHYEEENVYTSDTVNFLGSIASQVANVIDRKRAEEELKRTNSLLAATLQSTADGIVVVDKKGTITNYNEKFVELWRIPASIHIDHADSKILSFVLDQLLDPADFMDKLKELSNDDENISLDIIQFKDGRLLECYSQPQFYGAKSIGRVWSFQDITEREKAENSLREKETVLRNLIEKIPDGVYKSTHEGKFMEVNPAMVKMLGYTNKEELLAIDIKNELYFDPADRESLILEEMLEEMGIFRLRKKDGTEIWVEDHGWYTSDTSGEILYHEGVIRDVSQRVKEDIEKQTCAEIVQGITTTTDLFELIKLIHNSLKKIVYAENCFIALYDRNTGLFNFPYFVDKFDSPPPPLALFKSCTAYVFRTGKSVVITKEVLTQLLEQHEVELVGSNSPSWIGVPLKTSDGIIGVLALQNYEEENVYNDDNLKFLDSISSQVANVIERKRAEAEIKKLNEELELRVISRTDQLQKANKDLEAFSYNAAHEIRTPLRALNGYANILLADYSPVLDSEGKRMLNVILSNAIQMGEMIDDLLSVSSLNQQELKKSTINMHHLAMSVYESVCKRKDKDMIDFRLQNIPDADGDPALIHQLWVVLISNAIKFTSKKTHRIIEVGFTTENESTIYRVKDNGAGFNMAYYNKLFSLFQRLHTVKEFEGSGVGLALAKQIVLKHKGRLWAEGKEDEGATFYFTLPNKMIK